MKNPFENNKKPKPKPHKANNKKKALKKIKGVALGVTGFVIISLLKSTCVRTKSK